MEAMFTMMQNTMRANGMPDPGQGGFGRGPGDAGPEVLQDPAAAGRRGDAIPGPFWRTGERTLPAPRSCGREKLGLKLERARPFDTVVIDHLEKTPTEN